MHPRIATAAAVGSEVTDRDSAVVIVQALGLVRVIDDAAHPIRNMVIDDGPVISSCPVLLAEHGDLQAMRPVCRVTLTGTGARELICSYALDVTIGVEPQCVTGGSPAYIDRTGITRDSAVRADATGTTVATRTTATAATATRAAASCEIAITIKRPDAAGIWNVNDWHCALLLEYRLAGGPSRSTS